MSMLSEADTSDIEWTIEIIDSARGRAWVRGGHWWVWLPLCAWWWGTSPAVRQTGEQPSSTAATPKNQKMRRRQHSFGGCMCDRCSHRAGIPDGGFQDQRPRFTLLPEVSQEVLPMWSIGHGPGAWSFRSEGEFGWSIFAVDGFSEWG